MSTLAALILATGAGLSATVLCVPLHRIAEMLSEVEMRSAGLGDYTPGSGEA